MKPWLRILLCSLLALLLGLAGGFLLRGLCSSRSAAALTSHLTLSAPADGSVSEGDTLSLVHCALDTLSAIEQEDYAALAEYVHPTSGVTFTPAATVDSSSNLNFLPDALTQAAVSGQTYVWGTDSTTSTPIKLSWSDYFAQYVVDKDYAASPRLSVDTPQLSGNAMDNTLDAYPGCHYVEFSAYSDNDQTAWSTLRLVYQWYNNAWYLVGIVHDSWGT